MNRVRKPSAQMTTLLRAFADRPGAWRHGYDLMKETALFSGTVYPLLVRMEEQGLVEADWTPPAKPGRPPRHAYRLTAAGIALAQSLAAETTGLARA